MWSLQYKDTYGMLIIQRYLQNADHRQMLTEC